MFTTVGALLAMGPWMWDARLKTATWMYPIFGTGYIYEPYLKPEFRYIAEAVLPLLLPLVVLAAVVWVLIRLEGRPSALGLIAVAFLCGAGVTVGLVGYSTRGESVGRYSFL